MLLQSYAQRRRKYSRKVGGGGDGRGGIGDSQTSFQKLLKGAFFAPKIW